MERDNFNVKISAEGTTKVVRKAPSSFQELKKVFKEKFGENMDNVDINYEDPEGEMITVEGDSDLESGYSLFEYEEGKTIKFIANRGKEGNKREEIEATPLMVELERDTENREERKEIAPPIDLEKVEHPKITCDGCGVLPIIGPRFNCRECPDYDLCRECEGKGVHNSHVMTRIPFPKGEIELPKGTVTAQRVEENGDTIVEMDFTLPQYKEGQQINIEELLSKLQMDLANILSHQESPKCKGGKVVEEESKEMGLNDSARIEIPDIEVMTAPNYIAFRPLTISNSGKEWPSMVILLKTQGDLHFEEMEIRDGPKSGENVTLTIPIQSPNKPGHYGALLRFKTPQGEYFGDEINIKVTVGLDLLTSTMEIDYQSTASNLATLGFGTFEECLFCVSQSNGNTQKAADLLIKMHQLKDHQD